MDVPPREWHPQHQLDELHIVVRLRPGREHFVSITGRSRGRRSSLFSTEEALGSEVSAVEIADRAAHATYNALRARPTSQALWDRSMSGEGLYEAPTLF